MESPNDLNLNKLGNGDAPAAPASKLGLIGIILGVVGLVIYCGPLAIAFVMGASGNASMATGSAAIGLSLLSYCGAFVSVIGAVLGIVSLTRGENKTYGIIAIVLGVVIMCTCVALASFGMFAQL